jgi:hypothetical protein
MESEKIINDIEKNNIIFVTSNNCHDHPDFPNGCLACNNMYKKGMLKPHIFDHTNIICDFFAYGNLQITNFINHLEKQKNCPCSTGWKITNGKFISSLLFIVGLVNIFISANKILYGIPLIGSSYVFIFVFSSHIYLYVGFFHFIIEQNFIYLLFCCM